jgi:mycoredoxin
MSEEQRTIVMYTTSWCPDCWRAKQVMSAMNVTYQEINITQDDDAVELVMELNNGNRSVPTIVFPDGSILTEPSTSALAQKLQAFAA